MFKSFRVVFVFIISLIATSSCKPAMYKFSSETTKHCLLIVLLTYLLTSCTYGPLRIKFYIESTKERLGTYELAVIVSYWQGYYGTGFGGPPVGLPRWTRDHYSLVYLCDVEKRTIKRLAKIDISWMTRSNFRSFIKGWKDESFYFYFKGCPAIKQCNTGDENTIYYRMDRSGNYATIDRFPEGFYNPINNKLEEDFLFEASAFTRGKKISGYIVKNINISDRIRADRPLFKLDETNLELVLDN